MAPASSLVAAFVVLAPLFADGQALRQVAESDDDSRTLLVIGAHMFGKDENDADYQKWKSQTWGRTILVEANPFVYRDLAAAATTFPASFGNVEVYRLLRPVEGVAAAARPGRPRRSRRRRGRGDRGGRGGGAAGATEGVAAALRSRPPSSAGRPRSDRAGTIGASCPKPPKCTSPARRFISSTARTRGRAETPSPPPRNIHAEGAASPRPASAGCRHGIFKSISQVHRKPPRTPAPGGSDRKLSHGAHYIAFA